MRIVAIFLYTCIFTHILHAELFTQKFKNGAIKSQIEYKENTRTETSKGIKHGMYKTFYNNGQIKLQVAYLHGKKHHIQNIYYQNGQLSTQVNYILGKREGLMREWDIDGFKSSEVFYVSNYKVGLKKFFDNTGKMSFSQEFKINRNPLIIKLFQDKQEEILMNLSKYDLLPKKMH
jgi:antitoxin component YwqK of YwqJK toxin-antitoxin module